MTSHDQLAKSLLKLYFADFLRLVDPRAAGQLRAAQATFLDKEAFTDQPSGDRREMDLVAEVPVEGEEIPLLIHVEIETTYSSAMGRRLWNYYMLLRLRHRREVLPIVLNLHGGPAGVRAGVLREGFKEKRTAVFRYRQLSLSGCRAEDWLRRPEPLAWAFAALMRPGRWSRAELKLECLRRIARSSVVGLRKQVLVNWVETYVQLTGPDAEELERLLDLEGNEEIKDMELTWLGQAEARGLEQGLVKGTQAATRQAVERLRSVVFRQIEQRFGTVPSPVRRKVEAMDALEPLAEIAERVFAVESVGELG